MQRREWFTPAEIAAARSPELPGTVRNINALADARKWRADPARARKRAGLGGGWEYHVSLLPTGAQARLALIHAVDPKSLMGARLDATSSGLWDRFERLSKAQKCECERRLAIIDKVDRLIADGMSDTAALEQAARDNDVSGRTLFRWRSMVAGLPTADRLAALVPGDKATASFADCHPKALEMLLSDWLRPERPAFSACYRRMRKKASQNGWLPIPSERALRRRAEAEVPEGVRVLAREGSKKAKTLYPAQQRTRASLHAMSAVNMDGHEIDVFVRIAERVVRMHLLALQDLYSGKIVAWRLSETENKETVRLAIGDMVEAYGIPEKIVLDNGRAFASKWISGGSPNRYRFRVREGDPQGLLTTLGVEIIWAKPYSGQSKPIERAFRDLAEAIAKHPFVAGAYTGNRPEAKPENYGARAIPIGDFRAHVAEQIDEHNAREGRTLETCAGRSFDATFAASMEAPGTIVSFPTDQQRALWMLAAERIRSRKGSGEIHFLENRYWAAPLNAYAGQLLTVRFDPDHLHGSVRVYTADDEFVCVAPCIAATGFFDQDAARIHARDRASYLKSLKEHERLRDKMSAAELARLYAPIASQARPEPVQPKVKRLAVAGGARAEAERPTDPSDFEESFSRGLRLIASND